jgi:hypothetical protein
MFRKMTPLARICLAAGLGLGLVLGLYFALGVPVDESQGVGVPRADLRLAPVFIAGLTLLGGVLGVGSGVALEAAFKERGPDGKKPWWRGKKSSRRRR